MPQIKNAFIGGSDAFHKNIAGLSAQYHEDGYPISNQVTYEQRAGLIADLISSGDLPTILSGKNFMDLSPSVDIFDRTNTTFLTSLGSYGHPNVKNTKDLEFYYAVLDINPLQWTTKAALKKVAGDTTDAGADHFVYGKTFNESSPTSGDDKPLIKISDLFDANDKMFFMLRHNMVLKDNTPGKNEQILIQEGSDGILYGIRGSHISGLIDSFSSASEATKLPCDVTTAHSKNKTWICTGQVMAELEEGGEYYRHGYDYRSNFVQIVDFMSGKGWLEGVLGNEVNSNRLLGDPVAYAKNRAQARLEEIWNNIALHGVMGRYKNHKGDTRFRTMGIIQAIKLYCTQLQGGITLTDDGYFPIGDNTHTKSSPNFENYKCNGDSNYRKGKENAPATPETFSKNTLDTLDLVMRKNVGLGANNEHLLPNIVWMPTEFYGVATQFDKERSRDHDPINTTAGYLATDYVTPQGTSYHFVKDDNLKNSILIGNGANGGRRPLASLLRYDFPLTRNRNEESQYISIQGFQWKRPELLWAYWENLTV